MRISKFVAGTALAALLLVGNLAAAGGALAQSPPEPPSRFVGTVTIDRQAAPAGTAIEARVGTASCGVTTVFLQGGQARYAIDVASAATQPGCGTPGATVSFLVGGAPAPQTGSWRNYELAQLDLTLTRATPPPGVSPLADADTTAAGRRHLCGGG